ncbi:YciI family protein [Salmonella enterica subsp. enterica serovar Newport]|nr:YciI family protein [Salmonella enterica subsp. enterica serovar Newport]
MLYAVLAYHEGGVVEAFTPQQDAALMDELYKTHRKHETSGLLGPAARLGPTEGAVTLRGAGAGTVIDGPFAETKEHLLGLYLLNCADLDEAIAFARDLQAVNKTAVYEIRPVTNYLPGAPIPASR